MRTVVSSFLCAWVLAGCAFPGKMINPVEGAGRDSWNPETFWYYPWGTSGVHKGIDIFAARGTPILAPQSGIIVTRGTHTKGGNRIYLLGPLFRIHYFAHMDRFEPKAGRYVSRGDTLGYLGTTGNAAGRPPHLHYHIITSIPYPWRWTSDRQGWKKIFYLDPGMAIRNE
jgi:murein DD-endopeptidase MepM/ murein hydrolase activator NlpD